MSFYYFFRSHSFVSAPPPPIFLRTPANGYLFESCIILIVELWCALQLLYEGLVGRNSQKTRLTQLVLCVGYHVPGTNTLTHKRLQQYESYMSPKAYITIFSSDYYILTDGMYIRSLVTRALFYFTHFPEIQTHPRLKLCSFRFCLPPIRTALVYPA